jgi:LysM repeat protein
MEERNQRPEDSSKLPIITLLVLVGFILAMLYIGYEYFSDTPQTTKNELSKATDNVVTEGDDVIPESVSTEKTTDNSKAAELEKKVEKPKTEPEKPKTEAKKLVSEIPSGGVIIPHIVQTGETFFGIANRYNLKADVLRALNPDVDPQSLKVGVTRLKVKIQAKHTIGPGDILSVVAKKYDISKKALMDANKLTKDFSKRGDELIIPLK